jgi:hypothetical protein
LNSKDYAEKDTFGTLQPGISSCVNTLSQFEELLNLYQQDLKNISHEIKALQDESMARSIKVNNRRVSNHH